MCVFLRIFDPKGYRYHYTDSDWRNVEQGSTEPAGQSNSSPVQEELQTRVRHQKPDDEDEEEESIPDPQENTLRKAKRPSQLENEYTDIREFYGPGDLTGIASDFMKTDILTVKAGSLVAEAAELFKNQTVTHLPVVTDKQLICGLITEHQLYRKLIDGSMTRERLDKEKVSEVMRSPVLCCLQGTPVEAILETFVKENVSILPVVDKNDQLKGMVDKMSLLKYFFESSHFFRRKPA